MVDEYSDRSILIDPDMTWARSLKLGVPPFHVEIKNNYRTYASDSEGNILGDDHGYDMTGQTLSNGPNWIFQGLLEKLGAAYGGTITAGPGTFAFLNPVSLIRNSYAQTYIIQGQGQTRTIIKGGAGCRNGLFRSTNTSWTGAPRLHLRDLTLEGSGVEEFLVYGNFALIHLQNVTLRGSMLTETSLLTSDAAASQKVVNVTDGTKFEIDELCKIYDDSNSEYNIIESKSGNVLYMRNNLANTYTTAANAKTDQAKGTCIYQAGSGPTSEPTVLDNVLIFPDTQSGFMRGIRAHAESYRIGTVNCCASYGNISTGVHLSNNPVDINNISGFVGGGKCMVRLLKTSASVSVGSMLSAISSTPTMYPFLVKSYLRPIEINIAAFSPMPTNGAVPYEDMNSGMATRIRNLSYGLDYASSWNEHTDPGTTYVEFTDNQRVNMDLRHYRAMRLVMENAGGSEDVDHGFGIYNFTDSEMLCVAEWSGLYNTYRVGGWVDISDWAGTKDLRLYVKGGSATDDVGYIYGVKIQFLGWRDWNLIDEMRCSK